MSFGSQKSSQTSTPVDMTPTAFKNMQTPFTARLSQLLGFSPSQFASFSGGAGGGSGPANAGGTATAGGGHWFQPPYGSGDNKDNTGNGGSVNRMPPPVWIPDKQPTTAGGGFDPASLYSGDLLSGIPQYKGPLTADLTKNEGSLLQQIMAKSGGKGPQSPAQQALLDIIGQKGPNVYRPDGTLADFADMLGGASNTGAFSGPEGNPFIQSYIEAAQRPTLEGLTETLTRDLPGRFTNAGQMIQPGSSSAFDRAAAIATRGAANANSDIATKISYQALADAQQREASALGDELGRRFTGSENNANRGLDAAKSLPGVTSQEVDTLIKSLQAEALPRLIKQEGIDKGMGLFKDRVDNLLKVLGITAGVTQPTISTQSSGKSSGFNFALPNS